jgi:hypothetical protein
MCKGFQLFKDFYVEAKSFLLVRESFGIFLGLLINKTVVPLGASKKELHCGKACGCARFINDFQDVDDWKKFEAKTLSLPIK